MYSLLNALTYLRRLKDVSKRLPWGMDLQTDMQMQRFDKGLPGILSKCHFPS